MSRRGEEEQQQRAMTRACRCALRTAGVRNVVLRRAEQHLAVHLCERDGTPRAGVGIYLMGGGRGWIGDGIEVPHYLVPRAHCPYTSESGELVAYEDAATVDDAARRAVLALVHQRLGMDP